MEDDDAGTYDTFRDCIFSIIVEKSASSSKKSSRPSRKSGVAKKDASKGLQPRASSPARHGSQEADASALGEFSDYLAAEIFTTLPDELKRLSYHAIQSDAELSERWSLPLNLSTIEEVSTHVSGEVVDSLVSYGLVEPPKSDIHSFMSGVLSAFIPAVTTPPPKWIATKTSACEICERDWVPLTYHHLIPRQIHAKVLKRGWHEEQQLNSVAWLCRSCHSFVHRMASNEELAREWYTVDRICERDDVQKWAQWVRRVRWKKT